VTVWYVKKKKITNIFTLIVNITKNIMLKYAFCPSLNIFPIYYKLWVFLLLEILIILKYKGKCLVKVNWIKSGIIIINDILDEYGHISEYKIIAKLRNKQNWISELNILKKAI
jgi:hypothetical protein